MTVPQPTEADRIWQQDPESSWWPAVFISGFSPTGSGCEPGVLSLKVR